MVRLEAYEDTVIKEIAKHIVEPNAVSQALQLMGKPIEKLMDIAENNKIVKKIGVTDVISSAIDKSLKITIKIANNLCSDSTVIKEYNKNNLNISNLQDIKNYKLNQIDMIADSYDISNAIIVGLEGALLGAATTLCEGLPGAQVIIPTIVVSDVTASMTLLCRHVCQIATSYGYSSRDPVNFPHIIASMAPHHNSSDEGFLSAKATAIGSIRSSSKYLIKNSGNLFDKELLEKEAPQLLKLISYLSERLGIVITEKEFGMIIPFVGAVANSGINVAFQQVGHTTAKDYFRMLILGEKYGNDEIDSILGREIEFLKTNKSA